MDGPPLRLLAFDADDLSVVSMHLQDAVLRASDVAFLAREQRFALVCDRFDWGVADAGACARRRTGLRFERVRAVKSRDVPQGSEMPLQLLALRFEPDTAPGGIIELVFAGGAGLRLEVDCIEAAMDDLGALDRAQSTPNHE
jgi:hypothetical protein